MLMASVRRRTGLFRCLRTERWVNGFTMERRACLDVCVLLKKRKSFPSSAGHGVALMIFAAMVVKMVGQSPFEEDVRAGFFFAAGGRFFWRPARFF